MFVLDPFGEVFMSPPLAAAAYWQTGVKMPVLRPVADYLPVVYSNEKAFKAAKLLISKQIFTFWDFRCILNRAKESSEWHFEYISHLEDWWKAVSEFRGAVVLPYDAQTLAGPPSLSFQVFKPLISLLSKS